MGYDHVTQSSDLITNFDHNVWSIWSYIVIKLITKCDPGIWSTWSQINCERNSIVHSIPRWGNLRNAVDIIIHHSSRVTRELGMSLRGTLFNPHKMVLVGSAWYPWNGYTHATLGRAWLHCLSRSLPILLWPTAYQHQNKLHDLIRQKSEGNWE